MSELCASALRAKRAALLGRWGPLAPLAPLASLGPLASTGPSGTSARGPSDRGRKIGEGGFSSVYAINDEVVCKVIKRKFSRDSRDFDFRAAHFPGAVSRELAIHRLANAAFSRGLTDHVVLLSAATSHKMETRLFLERFDCSLYDLPGRMRVDDAILRSVAMQALHGYEAMRRHFGFFFSRLRADERPCSR
jgi:hypothetical protein